jgi:hypothetical protein
VSEAQENGVQQKKDEKQEPGGNFALVGLGHKGMWEYAGFRSVVSTVLSKRQHFKAGAVAQVVEHLPPGFNPQHCIK